MTDEEFDQIWELMEIEAAQQEARLLYQGGEHGDDQDPDEKSQIHKEV